jgi:hypothetical protein
MANPGREAPLAVTGLVRQYKPEKTPFRWPRADVPAAKNHWVYLPLEINEATWENDPEPGQQSADTGLQQRRNILMKKYLLQFQIRPTAMFRK